MLEFRLYDEHRGHLFFGFPREGAEEELLIDGSVFYVAGRYLPCETAYKLWRVECAKERIRTEMRRAAIMDDLIEVKRCLDKIEDLDYDSTTYWALGKTCPVF